jgi:hypothetical protein
MALNKYQQDLVADLKSSDDKKVLSALDRFDKHASGDLIIPLLDLFASAEGQAKERSAIMLRELKVSAAEKILVDALGKKKYAAIKTDILSFLWNSGCQPGERVFDIVSAGLTGDYMLAFEALTLIDTLDGPFEETDLIEAQLAAKEFLVVNQKDDRFELVAKLLEKLRQMDSRVLD